MSGTGGNFIGNSVPQPTSPFSRVADAQDNLLRAVARVEALADTLLGPTPSPDSTLLGPTPSPDSKQAGIPPAVGVLGGLNLNVTSITAGVDRIHAACERIERSLP